MDQEVTTPVTPGSRSNEPKHEPHVERVRERWDIIVSAISISLGVAGLLLARNPELRTRLIGGQGSEISLGTLVKEKGSVRQRRHDSMVWRDALDEPNQVAAGDSIFTGEDGNAELALKEGQRIKILPGSLVVVPTEAPIDILEGSVQLNLSDKSKKIALKVKDRIYEIDAEQAGAQIEVHLNPNDSKNAVRFVSKKTSIQIQSAGKEKVEVRSGETATIDKSGKADVRSVTFEPLFPRKNDSILVSDTSSKVRFQWEASGDVKGVSSSLRVEVHGKGSFPVPPGTSGALLNLGSGKQFWRLTWNDPKSGPTYSPWVPFVTRSFEAPTILNPREGSKIFLEDGESRRDVVFGWKNSISDVDTMIELRAKGAQEPIVRKASANENIAQELGAGEYELRAWSRTKTGVLSRSSPWRSFTIVDPEELARQETERKKALEEKLKQEQVRREIAKKALEEKAKQATLRRELAQRAAEEAKKKALQRQPAQQATPKIRLIEDPAIYP